VGGDALHDKDQLTDPCVGKVLRWWRRGWARVDDRALINEYVILWEEGDRMLVFSCRGRDLRWMTHARKLLVHHSGVLELVDP
jgi:hypothetical protein